MFSKHPNGLIAAALANMGERFGFYIMMAILTLFISAKFGLSETTTGYIYSAFYASIYILALAGGIIADKTKNFKGTILAGLVMMAVVLVFPLLNMILPGNSLISAVSSKVDVGLVAICFTVIALLLDLAPQKEVIAKVPWKYDHYDCWGRNAHCRSR